MGQHSVFYYPYASLGTDQSLLLKAAALYFDKLFRPVIEGPACISTFSSMQLTGGRNHTVEAGSLSGGIGQRDSGLHSC